MKYDAFISYRHGGLDGLVAEKLHKMLETYRIPAAVAKKFGKKKLSRVFRDREELPTSSNLSDSINDALENSSYLLLICSKRTCASQWVMREVERFGEMHGKDKIITLLIEGEPDESFPPGLREREVNGERIFVEPLAADIRADTPAKSIRKLKEEKLRLLAPILRCAFDDLRRRHRRRKIRRITAAVSTAFIFSLSFGAFSTYQYIQIDRHMQLQLRNQSYYLAEYSAARLAAGDPETAMLLSLAALPENLSNPERPLVTAAERSLADALGVYDVTDGFKPHKSEKLPAAPNDIALSPGEKYAAAIYPFELKVFETSSGREVASLDTVESVLAEFEFLSDEIIVYAGAKGIEAFDLTSGGSVWRGRPATSIAVSGDKSVVAAVYKNQPYAVVYSADGEEIGEIPFNLGTLSRTMSVSADNSFFNPHDALFELNGDGTLLAVSFSDGGADIFDVGGAARPNLNASASAFRYEGGFYGDALILSLVEEQPYCTKLLVIDALTLKEIANYSSVTTRFIPLVAEDGVYVSFEDRIMKLNLENGALTDIVAASGRISAFAKNRSDFLIGETGGSYRFTDENNKAYESDYVCGFLILGERYALTGGYDSPVMRILKYDDRSELNLMQYDKSKYFTEAKSGGADDRAVLYSYKGFELYELGGTQVASENFADPDSVVDTQYDRESGNIAVIYKNGFKLYSGTDGSLLAEAAGKAGVNSATYTEYGIHVLGEDNLAALYSLTTGEKLRTAAASDNGSQGAVFVGERLLEQRGGMIYFGGNELGEYEFAGAAETGEGEYYFAVSDQSAGKLFNAGPAGEAVEIFTFKTLGRCEAYFCGGILFISPFNGGASAYTLRGEPLADFDEEGNMTEVFEAGEYIAAGYVSVLTGGRYTILLERKNLETAAYLPGFSGLGEGNSLIFDDGNGNLRKTGIYSIRELIDTAVEILGGRTLSAEEQKIFKVE